ncbi:MULTISPECIES: class I SAM-dependent methyltransferase [unclassified Mesorhizobium]|uniref:class I SAM-dependent methyltransferase n=1 Tax=unclassified Mesorhizobium TaxID=325217 RepID=UPI000410D726|nr:MULTISPECIES: class I SAM-dependent methyltransferase [unclassified Mesorhizobium]WJI75772.1 class I SAM-dependent methyltransferase [Mesorhizobium sp. C395A]
MFQFLKPRPTVHSPATPLRPVTEDCVDRLSLLDGILIATGWTTGADPVILYDGKPVPNQVCVRFARPGLATTAHDGFRVAAPLVDRNIANQNVSVGFDNGNRLRRSPKHAETSTSIHARFCKAVADRPGAPLIEIGSRARSGNTYRHFFPDCRYFGIDVSAGPNVDFVTDAHTMEGVTETFDFAFSISVFEHLMMPWVAAHALNRVLNVGGLAFIQSHPAWPLHEVPWDFFRFSKESWSSIFNKFTGFEVLDAGYALEAAIVPANMESGPLQTFDEHPTFLLSACLARKVGPPTADWAADPATIYNLNYSH